MTMRNASLTAIAALTVALAGGAIAQDSNLAPGTSAPAGSSYQSTDPAAPAAEATTAQSPAEPVAEATEQAAEAAAEAVTEVQSDAPAATEAATTEAADTAAEAATADQAAEAAAPEAAATEAPAAEAPAESADQSAAEVAVEGQAQPEPTEAAAEVTAPEAGADAGDMAETAVEAESAEAPVATDAPSDAAVDEAAAEADAEAGHDAAAPAAASHEAAHIEDIAYSFEGPFGKYDQFQLQRGLQVYTEVCAACHGLRYVPLRTLADPGGPELPEDQVRAYAANFDITDPETEEDRPRIPTDHFPTVLGEGMGPDLSLMAKARAAFHGPYGSGISQLFNGIGGPEYIHAVLTGYNGETKEEAGAVLYHNAAFAGNWIQMPAPLADDQVTYEDGTPATVDQMAQDVAAFLMWTAEPKMMDRKQVGFVSVLLLIVLAALLYLTNKKLWWSVKHPRKPE